MENANDISQATEIYQTDPLRGFDLLYRGLANRLATYLRRAFSLADDDIADAVHDSFLPWVDIAPPPRIGYLCFRRKTPSQSGAGGSIA